MITSATTAPSTPATGTNGTSNSALSDANASQDRFLKLLVAQLNNQDPMNPLDNAQMTSQMAQINTVTGIQQVNETLKGVMSQLAGMQVLQSASLVGHEVWIDSNTLNPGAGLTSGAVELESKADAVKVEILSPAGQVIDTIDLGAQEAGRHPFKWDASKYTAAGNPTVRISATLNGNPVNSKSLTTDRVVSVSSENGALTVQLAGRGTASYDVIRAIL